MFGLGESDTENSLIGIGRSLIVENNYGYDVFGFQTGAVQSKPGVARIDIAANKKSCTIVWTSNEIVPSVISKASIATGLIHTYTRAVDPNGVQAWYWTAHRLLHRRHGVQAARRNGPAVEQPLRGADDRS